ncbi:MAG: histidine phosphatase family protein, partial [Clostridia bacterium]|nr:histidine phosphatase family protein [Clostridia bacterium]
IMARYRELAEKWFSDPGDMRVPEGESLREVADRASRAILFIVDRHPGETVAVVSHGGTIRVIITAVLGLFLRSVWSFQVDNGSLSVIDFYPSRAVLVKLNDASHLETDNEF